MFRAIIIIRRDPSYPVTRPFRQIGQTCFGHGGGSRMGVVGGGGGRINIDRLINGVSTCTGKQRARKSYVHKFESIKAHKVVHFLTNKGFKS